MSDRPTVEQQLAEVIDNAASAGEDANELAAAIVAAVESGRIDPIVPAWTDDAVIASLGERFGATRLLAELAELRALKAKVDSCERESDLAVRLPDRWAWRTAGAFLAWLREASDG